MIPCIVVGDSLAVGVGMFRRDCQTVAKVGITSQQYLRTLLSHVVPFAHSAVISLGVNDGASLATIGNLRLLRSHLRVRHAYWLLPGRTDLARRVIRAVATEYGDYMIDTRPVSGPDHLHPTGRGYQQIAALTARNDAAMARLGQ